MYENQKNFCSEFMRCFINAYVDGLDEMNKMFKKNIEKVIKNLGKNKNI